MKNAIIILSLIILAGLGVAGGHWMSQTTGEAYYRVKTEELEAKLKKAEASIARLTKEVVRLTQNRNDLPAEGTGGVASSVDGAGRVQTSYLGNGVSAAPAPTPAAPMAPVVAATATVESTPPSATTTTSTDPRVLKNLALAEASYAGLINNLGLQGQEKDYFKEMAARREQIRKQALAQLDDPSLTEEQRRGIINRAKQLLDENNEEMRGFLNDDADFQRFNHWEQTHLEREMMETGRSIFENAGDPLSPEDEITIPDDIYKLRKNTKGIPDPYDADTTVGVQFSQDYVARALAKYDADTEILLQSYRGRYSPLRLKNIRTLRQQNRVNLESRLWNLYRTKAQ